MNYFSRRTLFILFLLGCIVLVVALFIPTNFSSDAPQPVPVSEVGDSSGGSISDLFETENENSSSPSNAVPTDIPKDEACNLEGQTVRSGTVSSNTTCIKEPTSAPAN